MTETEFHQQVDQTLTAIELVLDEAVTDLDYENTGGVLTILCENKSQLIFTRQTPVHQLWLAARSGGFHFDYSAEQQGWVHDKDGRSLAEFFAEQFSLQSGETLSFNL